MKTFITIEEIEELMLEGGDTFIWGLGQSGDRMYRYLRERGYGNKITGFCGNDKVEPGLLKNGLPVYSYEQLAENYGHKEMNLLLASMYEWDIYQQLKEYDRAWNICFGSNLSLGFSAGREYFLSYSKGWKKFREEHPEADTRLAMVKDLLEDERSVYVLEQLIKIRDTADFHLFPEIYSNPNDQYFEKGIVSLSEDEVFIDCGGFQGETAIEFIRRVRERFQSIYIFEPSDYYYKKTLDNVRNAYGKLRSPIIIKNCGIWDTKGTVRFDTDLSGDGGSRITEKGGEVINTMALDEMFQEIPVSYVKMDIEGAETKALLGGAGMIKKYKPRLAVCVYHKPGDIYEIPLLLKSLVPEYKFYLRHYMCNHLETVLYADVNESRFGGKI